MNFISQIKKQKNLFLGKIEFDSDLSKYSWFNTGGSAKVIFKPKNLADLSLFLNHSNLLVDYKFSINYKHF